MSCIRSPLFSSCHTLVEVSSPSEVVESEEEMKCDEDLAAFLLFHLNCKENKIKKYSDVT